MKILCAFSSIEFTCEHFPGYLSSRESYHPIFNLPTKRLFSYLGKWSAGELTRTDSYLLFLSLFHSTDLVEFRVPAIRTEQTDSIIASNMEYLARTVSKINAVLNPAVIFPHYVISPDTKDLANVHHWIANWEDAYEDFCSGKRRDYDERRQAQRENALERLIKSPHRDIRTYAAQLADWAAIAGTFPEFLTTSPFTGLKVSISDYWKTLISKSASESSLFSIPRKDLEELLEHCETEIPIGSIHSNILFKVLRSALHKQKNFLELGDKDLGPTTYNLLSSSDSTESANLKAIIDSAPDHEPRENEYPTKIAYLKAKSRWIMAKKYGAGVGT